MSMSLPLWTCLWFILRCASKSELINISIHNIYFITVRVSFRFIISYTFSYIIFAMSPIVKCLFLYFLRRTNQQKNRQKFPMNRNKIKRIKIRFKGDLDTEVGGVFATEFFEEWDDRISI